MRLVLRYWVSQGGMPNEEVSVIDANVEWWISFCLFWWLLGGAENGVQIRIDERVMVAA